MSVAENTKRTVERIVDRIMSAKVINTIGIASKIAYVCGRFVRIAKSTVMIKPEVRPLVTHWAGL